MADDAEPAVTEATLKSMLREWEHARNGGWHASACETLCRSIYAEESVCVGPEKHICGGGSGLLYVVLKSPDPGGVFARPDTETLVWQTTYGRPGRAHVVGFRDNYFFCYGPCVYGVCTHPFMCAIAYCAFVTLRSGDSADLVRAIPEQWVARLRRMWRPVLPDRRMWRPALPDLTVEKLLEAVDFQMGMWCLQCRTPRFDLRPHDGREYIGECKDVSGYRFALCLYAAMDACNWREKPKRDGTPRYVYKLDHDGRTDKIVWIEGDKLVIGDSGEYCWFMRALFQTLFETVRQLDDDDDDNDDDAAAYSSVSS